MVRLLLVALVTFSAFGQNPNFPRKPQLPPDIVPPETFARRDPLRIDPTHYTLDFENEHVRVIRLALKADERVPMHDDVDATAVCIQDCHLRFTEPGGHIQDIHMATGETRWLWGDAHSAKNLNTQPMEMVFIEVKAASKGR
jgi:hypothetical protein